MDVFVITNSGERLVIEPKNSQGWIDEIDSSCSNGTSFGCVGGSGGHVLKTGT